ncbi:MAG TPA: hypothetical protein PLL10_00025 [Elusimicrobiales bacterium]|nr:hypothetical protein [Elusimicrobiales bacterium]
MDNSKVKYCENAVQEIRKDEYQRGVADGKKQLGDDLTAAYMAGVERGKDAERKRCVEKLMKVEWCGVGDSDNISRLDAIEAIECGEKEGG